MLSKTKDYDIFKFREDNREKIDKNHVQKLVESIKSRNLLDLRPIIVNKDMEILDGQHRLLAAKQLGVEIYYKKQVNFGSEEILIMNISKSWTCGDYLNYYVKNGFSEYIKLKNFMNKNNLNLKVALNISMGRIKAKYKDFKEGKFSFKEEDLENVLDVCWETIGLIKKSNGFSPYCSSNRFWKALLMLTNHEDFNINIWRENIKKMVERFNAKATTNDYIRLILDIYNYRNPNKISLLNQDGF